MSTDLFELLEEVRDSIFLDENTVNQKLLTLFESTFSTHAISTVTFEKYPMFDTFYKNNIHKFSVKIYNDGTPRPLESEFEVIVKKSQFLFMFKKLEDIVGYSLHLFLHRYLDEYWKRIMVQKKDFTQVEIDFLEDVFIQSVVFQASPKFVTVYINQITELYRSFGMTNGEDVAPALSLMRPNADIKLLPFKAIHDWLYSLEDRLNVETFERYLYIFSKLKQTEDFQNCIKPMQNAELITQS